MVTRGSPKPLFWVRVLVPLPVNENAESRDSAFFLLLSPIPHQGLIHFIKAITIQVNVKVIGDIHISVSQEARKYLHINAFVIAIRGERVPVYMSAAAENLLHPRKHISVNNGFVGVLNDDLFLLGDAPPFLGLVANHLALVVDHVSDIHRVMEHLGQRAGVPGDLFVCVLVQVCREPGVTLLRLVDGRVNDLLGFEFPASCARCSSRAGYNLSPPYIQFSVLSGHSHYTRNRLLCQCMGKATRLGAGWPMEVEGEKRSATFAFS